MHALPQMHAAQACLFKFNRLICNENKSRTDPSFKLPFTTQNNGRRAQILNLGERQNDFRIDFGWNFLQAGAILRLFCASQIWGQWRPPFATDEASVEPGDAGWGGAPGDYLHTLLEARLKSAAAALSQTSKRFY